MARRPRIDSAASAVKIMQGAQREIAPPGHVRFDDSDWPYWHSVVEELPRSEWTNHKIEMAALLARTMSDLEREQQALRLEGSVIETTRGAQPNPRVGIVAKCSATIMQYRRSLGLTARAQNASDPENIGKRRAIAKGVEQRNPLVDDLLGMPGDGP